MKAYENVGNESASFKIIQQKVSCMYKTNKQKRKMKNTQKHIPERKLAPPSEKSLADAVQERRSKKAKTSNENNNPNAGTNTSPSVATLTNDQIYSPVDIRNVQTQYSTHRGPLNQDTSFLDAEVELDEVQIDSGDVDDDDDLWR